MSEMSKSVKRRLAMQKPCSDCKWMVFKDSVGMDYCIRPDSYQLLTVIERGVVDERDLPKIYDLCGPDAKWFEPKDANPPRT